MKQMNSIVTFFATAFLMAVPINNVSAEVNGQLLADQVSELILNLTRDGQRPDAGGIGDDVLTYLNAPNYVWAAQHDTNTECVYCLQ